MHMKKLMSKRRIERLNRCLALMPRPSMPAAGAALDAIYVGVRSFALFELGLKRQVDIYMRAGSELTDGED